MSAVIRNDQVQQLDRKAQPDEQVTEEQAKDPARLARLLMSILRDVALLKRRWWPRRIDFEDYNVDATRSTRHRFPHHLRSRVRWWVVGWDGAAPVDLAEDATSDTDTLVLVSGVAGTLTLRIEEAG